MVKEQRSSSNSRKAGGGRIDEDKGGRWQETEY